MPTNSPTDWGWTKEWMIPSRDLQIGHDYYIYYKQEEWSEPRAVIATLYSYSVEMPIDGELRMQTEWMSPDLSPGRCFIVFPFMELE